MWHAIDPLATTLFGLGCFGIGVGVATNILKRRHIDSALHPLDPGLEAEIEQRASDWAEERGTPELAGLVQRRLQMAGRLAQRTESRWNR